MERPEAFVHLWRPPERADEPTLLLLHGTGGDERALLPLADVLAPGSGMLSPRGRVSERGMPRWFRRHAEGVFDTEDLVVRAGELADFVDEASRYYGFPRDRVVAVGFSNGANIAAGAMLIRPEVFRGAVLLAPMVPLRPDGPPDLSGVGVLIGAGRGDPIAPPSHAEELARLLTDAGAAVELVWHDGGHQVGPEVLEAARAWMVELGTATGSGTQP